jgi:hypothetical protein
MRKFILLSLLSIFGSGKCFSQKGMTMVGFHIKPMLPFSVLTKGDIINDTAGVHFKTSLNSGFSAGLVVRHNFTNLIAIETGINYCKRKYSLNITDENLNDQSYFRIIGYEIPAMLMIYAQLGEKVYINGSMGPVLDMFASDIETYDTSFRHVAFRRSVFQPAIGANAGFEYRTEKSGIIYLGASYQRPFNYIYLSKVGWYGNKKEIVVENELSGSYLSIDLRYYFPETKSKNVE